jgi:hypothetical protein
VWHNEINEKSQAQYSCVLMTTFYRQKGITDKAQFKDMQGHLVQATEKYEAAKKQCEITDWRAHKLDQQNYDFTSALEINPNKVQQLTAALQQHQDTCGGSI